MIEWGNNWARGVTYRKDDAVAGFFSQIGQLYQVHHVWSESIPSLVYVLSSLKTNSHRIWRPVRPKGDARERVAQTGLGWVCGLHCATDSGDEVALDDSQLVFADSLSLNWIMNLF